MIRALTICATLLASWFTLHAQDVQTSFTIHPYMGTAPFVLNSVYRSLANDQYIKPTSLRYYLSKISIFHDGGIVTSFPTLYILVDHAEPTTFQLGSQPITRVDSIAFSIGVDSARNHLDPATYPPFHPLSPQDPSMHWGWTSGYKFMAYNLLSDADTVAMKYVTEIHALGDANYNRVSVAVPSIARDGKVSIDLHADVAELLRGIDVSKGLYEHSEEGLAKLMLLNASQRVFSASAVTSVVSDESNEGVAGQGGTAAIFDLRGVLVRVADDRDDATFDGLPAGVYVIVRTTNGREVRHSIRTHDGR